MATLRDNVSAVRNLDSRGWHQVCIAADADCLLNNGNLRQRITRVLAHWDQPETVISQMLQSFYSNGALRSSPVPIRFQPVRYLCIAMARLRVEHQARMHGRVCSNTKIVDDAVRVDDTEADLMLGFLSRLLPSLPEPPRLFFRRKHR
jgi:hypothetical protein